MSVESPVLDSSKDYQVAYALARVINRHMDAKNLAKTKTEREYHEEMISEVTAATDLLLPDPETETTTE